MNGIGSVLRRVKRRLFPAREVEVMTRVAGAETPVLTLRDERPFGRGNTMAQGERRRWRTEIEAAGLRAFPYPFATMLAFVSDCDKCARLDYQAYRSRFVDELGLDFGDSCKLMNRTPATHHHDSLCIYRYDGEGPPRSEEHRFLDETFGFLEMLREVHLGNVDHYHFFSGSGPRVFFVPDVRDEGNGRWSATLPGRSDEPRGPRKKATGNFNFGGDYLPIATVVVQPRHGALPEATEVRIVMRDGNIATAPYDRVEWGDDAWRPRFSPGDGHAAVFCAVSGATTPESLPLASKIDHVEVALPTNAAPVQLEAVFLLNVHRGVLRRMMDDIVGRLGFKTCLLTDHGSRLHIDANSEARHAQANGDRAFEGRLSALSSRVQRDDLRYSVLGDDPESFAYLWPQLRDDYGVRYINPGGGSSEPGKHIDLLDVVLPARTRDGSTVYVARRTAGALHPTDGERHPLRNDHGTRSFPTRLATILEEHTEHPEAVYPVYTHLGNVKPKTERPDPYYPERVFETLQDRHFNVSGTITPEQRIWMTRGTVLYDYAAMIRSVASHVSRAGANVVDIESWRDPVLGRRFPESPAQMHGLTFYVDDRAAGRVRLDGEDVADLTRNTADETGRESVTVIGADIRHVLLDEVDVEPETRGLTWTWIADPKTAYRGDAYARLTLDSGGAGSATWSPGDVRAAGAQLLSWAVRTNGDVRTAVIIETETGGCFRFGDTIVVDEPLTASYECAPVEAGDWHLHLAPFYDMTWADSAQPGGPIPSHRTTGVRLLVQGDAGAEVHIDQLELLRPLTTAHPSIDPLVVIGGQILGHRPSMRVHLRCDGKAHTHDVADPQGFFYFPGVSRGAVELWVEDTATGQTWDARRGRRFTAASNDMNLIVEAE